MKPVCRSLILSIAALGLASGPAPAAADPAAGPQREAIDELRAAGVALFEWHRGSARELPKSGEASSAESLDIRPAAVLDAAAARRLGLPAAVVALLEGRDPWGNAYEVRLGDGSSAPTLVVRCAGSDGDFEAELYPIGAFDVEETARDIVWADGYFVRWPQRRG